MVSAVQFRGKQDIRDRILDAAEELFAERGYDGVPIREIMRKAGVELGNAAYYFGKKEELLRQVVARRADEIVEESVGRLDAVIQEWRLQQMPDSLERLIEALIAPVVEKMTSRGPGWRSYIRLISSLINIDKDQTYLKSVHDYMDPTIYKFIEGVGIMYPDCPEEKIYLFYYFVNGFSLHMLLETKSIDVISGGILKTTNYDYIMAYLPGFFAAGFRKMLSDQL